MGKCWKIESRAPTMESSTMSMGSWALPTLLSWRTPASAPDGPITSAAGGKAANAAKKASAGRRAAAARPYSKGCLAQAPDCTCATHGPHYAMWGPPLTFYRITFNGFRGGGKGRLSGWDGTQREIQAMWRRRASRNFGRGAPWVIRQAWRLPVAYIHSQLNATARRLRTPIRK